MRDNRTTTSGSPACEPRLYGPLPKFIQPLVDDLAGGGVFVDLDRLADDRLADDGPRARSRRSGRDQLIAGTVDAVHRTDKIVMSSKSCALVNQAGSFAHQHSFSQHFYSLAPGGVLVDVTGPVLPWRVLAHLSGDPFLTAAVDSGDVYAYTAIAHGVSRTVAKAGLFIGVFQGSPNGLRALLSGEPDPEAAYTKALAVVDLIPDAMAFVADLAPYRLTTPVIQGLANRISNRIHAHAHALIVAADLAKPALLLDPETVLYEAADRQKAAAVVALLDDAEVTCEGVTVPVLANAWPERPLEQTA